MTSKNEIFGKYNDETGEAYYCPVSEVADNNIVSKWEMDNCVDVSTVEGYAGNLNVADPLDFQKDMSIASGRQRPV